MAEKRQKKQAAKAFEKETFSKDKEVTGVKHIEHRQDNTFSVENQFSASEKPVSNLPSMAVVQEKQLLVTASRSQSLILGQNTGKIIRKNITDSNNRTLLVTASRSRKPKRKRHS